VDTDSFGEVGQVKTQCETLLAAFRRGESFTTLEAMRLPEPICRLSERVRELERKGHLILRADEKQNGRKYTRYFMRESVAA
jgi:hypothetical protein